MMRTVVFSPIFRSDFCSKENCNSHLGTKQLICLYAIYASRE